MIELRKGLHRRTLLRASLAGTVMLNIPPPLLAAAKLPLKLAGYDFDRTHALVNGEVGIDGCSVEFQPAAIGDININLFSGPQTWDVTEVGLHPYILAYANGGFRDYSLLPIYPLRMFRHKSVFIRTDRGINTPEDLKGRKVATPGFSSSSLTWLRGIFEDEYGVKPSDMEWVISAEDSASKVGGKTSAQEQVVPKGLKVSQGPPGQDESDLLESGFVDALFHAVEPRAYVQGDPRVARLFADPRRVEQAYYRKTGIFPIMHCIAIRNSLAEQHPWLPAAVFAAYSTARNLSYRQLNKLWIYSSLPWVGQDVEETRRTMGNNFWSYGLDEQNRKTLETLTRYSYQQGLAKEQLSLEQLFHPASFDMVDVG